MRFSITLQKVVCRRHRLAIAAATARSVDVGERAGFEGNQHLVGSIVILRRTCAAKHNFDRWKEPEHLVTQIVGRLACVGVVQDLLGQLFVLCLDLITEAGTI